MRQQKNQSKPDRLIHLVRHRPTKSATRSETHILTLIIDVDASTGTQIEILRLRDGLSMAEYQKRAAQAYALMLPGWPYPP